MYLQLLMLFFPLKWQHVLEHGKPYEKAEIMKKLAGQIVQMSQHKFASNVVEKCLEFGGPNERQILISEMLGLNDENEPLQVVSLKSYFPLMMGSRGMMLALF